MEAKIKLYPHTPCGLCYPIAVFGRREMLSLFHATKKKKKQDRNTSSLSEMECWCLKKNLRPEKIHSPQPVLYWTVFVFNIPPRINGNDFFVLFLFHGSAKVKSLKNKNKNAYTLV